MEGTAPAAPPGQRMLFVVYPAQFSGAELFSVQFMRVREGALVACLGGSDTERLMRENGLDTVATRFRPLVKSQGRARMLASLGQGLLGARELRRVLRAHPERDVIYATSMRAGMLASVAALGLRGRRVAWGLWDPVPGGGLGRLARGLAVRRCDLVVACSDYVRSAFTDSDSRLAELTETVQPGVRVERFAAARADPGAARALLVGSIIPEKRVELALEVAARVSAQRPGFTLHVLGRPQYHPENELYAEAMRGRAEGEDLRHRVVFHGHVTDLPAAMGGTGLLLHCREDEPFAAAVLEAMAAGLPVVAPRSGGCVEAVQDGRTGLLYEPGSADHAAACVVRLIEDRDLATRLGTAGRARVRELWTAEAYLERQERALARLRA